VQASAHANPTIAAIAPGASPACRIMVSLPR
jgi:hypothetical protein